MKCSPAGTGCRPAGIKRRPVGTECHPAGTKWLSAGTRHRPAGAGCRTGGAKRDVNPLYVSRLFIASDSFNCKYIIFFDMRTINMDNKIT
jgi:hypothetical protein